jgi:predicted DCC family thiol-disulfide oxidoreductase YuxK
VLAVLYDADCGFCTWTAAAVRRLDRDRKLRLIPLQVAAERLASVPHDLGATLHVVDEHGRWERGASAWLRIGDELPWLRLLARLGRVPPFRQIVALAYVLIARNRHRLGRLAGMPSCDLDRYRGVPLA